MNSNRCHGKAESGFTLIELLIVIAIIGILISIMFPALGKARATARQTAGLANLRSVGTSFSQYADQYKSWPFAKKGTVPEGVGMPPNPDIMFVRWWPENSIIGTSEAWHLSYLWPGVVAPFTSWPENYRLWVSPGLSKELPDFSFLGDFENIRNTVSLRYSNSFIANSKLFSAAAVADENLMQPVQQHEVGFPANKVVLWDAHLAYLNKTPHAINGQWAAPTPMAFADLHADLKDPTKAAAPVGNPLKHEPLMTLHDTPDGVQGRDY